MASRILLATALLLTTGAAGCLGLSDGDDDPAEAASTSEANASVDTAVEPTSNLTGSEIAEPRFATTWFNGSTQSIRVSDLYVCPPPPAACDNAATFPVAAGVTAVVVEVAWDASTELDIFVNDGQNEPVAQVTGATSPARVVVDGGEDLDATGDWSADVWTRLPTEAVAFTLAATAVYDAPVPEGFSRVGE